MGFKVVMEIIQASFMAIGLLIVLPPVLTVRLVKFLRE